MNDTDTLLHEVALTLFSGVGPQLTRQLMSYGGSARNVLHPPPGKLRRIPGVGDATVGVLTGPERGRALARAETSLRKAEKEGVQLLFYTSKQFPARLKQFPDAPALLYYQGTAARDSAPMRWLVTFLWALDLLHIMLISHLMYFYLISNFGDVGIVGGSLREDG